MFSEIFQRFFRDFSEIFRDFSENVQRFFRVFSDFFQRFFRDFFRGIFSDFSKHEVCHKGVRHGYNNALSVFYDI